MTPLQTDKTVKAQSILERSVVMILRITRLGSYRKIDSKLLGISKDGQELSEEKKSLSIVRRLIDSSDVSDCNAIIDAARADVRKLSIHGHRVFGDGAYIVPVQNVEKVEEVLETRQKELASAVDELANNWDDTIKRNKARLGKLAADVEFPTSDDARSEFALDWSYVSFATPDRLEEVSQLAHARAVAKEQARFSAAYDEVIVGLRSAALRVLTEFANRLKPGADGKPKAIRGTALDDLRELIEQLPVLNMADDDDLAGILAKVGALTSGVNVETLRNAPAIRGLLLEEAERAARQVQALVEDGERGIRFGKR